MTVSETILSFMYRNQPSKREYRTVDKNIHYLLVDGGTGFATTFAHYVKSPGFQQEIKELEHAGIIGTSEDDVNNSVWRLLREKVSIHKDLLMSKTEKTTRKRPQYRLSFMNTEGKTNTQRPHFDFPWQGLESITEPMPYLGVFPLTEEGMFLQIWLQEGDGTIVSIPYGRLLIVPGSCIHGGGFKSCPGGNPRVPFYMFLGEVWSQTTNQYTNGQGKRISGNSMLTKLERSTRRQVTNNLIGNRLGYVNLS